VGIFLARFVTKPAGESGYSAPGDAGMDHDLDQSGAGEKQLK
jgi:hypothetical protein